MEPTHIFRPRFVALIGASVLMVTGCATNDTAGSAAGGNQRFRTPDDRKIEIGKATPEDGGRSFRNPHMEKCWIADGFNFSGYDTLYIVPTASTAKFNADEETPHKVAKERLPLELAIMMRARGIFPNVVTSESEIKPGAKVLRLENTITEYAKGGGAARYFAGLYGAGQPIIRVVGAASDNGKEMFKYQMRRSGVSGGARMAGAFMTDIDIQTQDLQSLALDLTDFMAAIAGKYEAR